jgi:hypothetical protein
MCLLHWKITQDIGSEPLGDAATSVTITHLHETAEVADSKITEGGMSFET